MSEKTLGFDSTVFRSLAFMACRHSVVLMFVAAVMAGACQYIGVLDPGSVRAVLGVTAIFCATLWAAGCAVAVRRQKQLRARAAAVSCLAVQRSRKGIEGRGLHVCHKTGLYYGQSQVRHCEHRAGEHCAFPNLGRQLAPSHS